MGDVYRDAAARAARLEEIAQRREDIELKRLEREERRLLAFEQAHVGTREAARELIDLTKDSPPPPEVKQEIESRDLGEHESANDRRRALRNSSGLIDLDQGLQATTSDFHAALTPSSITPRVHPLQAARSIKTEEPDLASAQNQSAGTSETSASNRPSIMGPLASLNQNSANAATSGPLSSNPGALKRRIKKKKRRTVDQPTWRITNNPDYRTIVKASSNSFVELSCYLCHGNFRDDHYIGGPTGFIQHLKICHPEAHPSGTKLTAKRVIELCGIPISREIITGILQKRDDAYQVPQRPVIRAPENSRIHAAVAASQAHFRSFDSDGDGNEEDEEDEEDEDEDDDVAMKRELTGRKSITTRRSGTQLLWTKEMGTHPVAEKGLAGDSDEE